MKKVKDYVPQMLFSMRWKASKAEYVLNEPCESMRDAIGILSTAWDNLDWFEFWMDSVEKMKRQGKL